MLCHSQVAIVVAHPGRVRKARIQRVHRAQITFKDLNAKYPNGIEAQKEKLEAEGHTIIQKGRKNIRYYVKDYENSLFDLK